MTWQLCVVTAHLYSHLAPRVLTCTHSHARHHAGADDAAAASPRPAASSRPRPRADWTHQGMLAGLDAFRKSERARGRTYIVPDCLSVPLDGALPQEKRDAMYNKQAAALEAEALAVQPNVTEWVLKHVAAHGDGPMAADDPRWRVGRKAESRCRMQMVAIVWQRRYVMCNYEWQVLMNLAQDLAEYEQEPGVPRRSFSQACRQYAATRMWQEQRTWTFMSYLAVSRVARHAVRRERELALALHRLHGPPPPQPCPPPPPFSTAADWDPRASGQKWPCSSDDTGSEDSRTGDSDSS